MGNILCLSWSPNGKYIASGSLDGTVRIWNVDYTSSVFGTRVKVIAPIEAFEPITETIRSIANSICIEWDPTSSLLGVGYTHNLAYIYNIMDPQMST